MSHLLVIDDDERLRKLLGQYLIQCDFQVSLAEQPSQADELLQLFSFDAIVMDVMMPNKDGMTYTKELRARGIDTPILMLTAMTQTNHRIQGLENGADDYLCKPFDPKELLLRIQNLLKRHVSYETQIIFGPYQYDLKTSVLTKSGQAVYLTTAEQQLLSALAQNSEGYSREELAQLLHLEQERTVDVQMARLRRKIETDPKHPVWIQTIRGKGYKLIRN